MRFVFLVFFMITGLASSAQRVRISGVLKDSDLSSVSGVRAILNDTVNRYIAKYLKIPIEPGQGETFMAHFQESMRLSTDSNYVVRPGKDHTFSLYADLKDSIIFSAIHHFTQRHSVSELLGRDSIVINLVQEPCIPYVPCNEVAAKTYVFIGEKISVKRSQDIYYCNRISMDSQFDAKYRIVKNIQGNYKADTIQFTVYDHYGSPAFSDFKYVMLFVSEYCGKLIHQKYQFFDVYRTKNGRWASPGDPLRYDRPDSTGIRGEPISFGGLVFDKLTDGRKQYRKFEAPYYKIHGNCAEPVRGAYIEELFDVKKNGVLKARGIKF